MPATFDGNNPRFLEWTSEVKRLPSTTILHSSPDSAFIDVTPVTLNDIYGGRDESENIDNGICKHQAGITTLNEEPAQREHPVPEGAPARREAAAINADIATVMGQ